MDPLTITAASGLRARLESLDLLSNNLANASTPGFKADRESYATYISSESEAALQSGVGRGQALSPLSENNWVDLRAGQIRQTGNPSDFAIEGDGFLVADGPGGPLLTRGGELRVQKDGRLVTREGYEVHTVEPRRIRARSDLPLELRPDGTVWQDGAALGRIRLVELPSGSGAPKREGAYFRLDSSALPAAKPGRGQLKQGFVEESNVSPAESATRLIEIMRQFEGLQRAIQIGGEMSRKSVEEVARVAP